MTTCTRFFVTLACLLQSGILISAAPNWLLFARRLRREETTTHRPGTCHHHGEVLNDGQQITDGTFVFQCYATADSWRVPPIGCLGPGDAVKRDGEKYRDGDYVKICRVDESGKGKVESKTVGCVGPDGRERKPGDSWVLDNTGATVTCLEPGRNLLPSNCDDNPDACFFVGK